MSERSYSIRVTFEARSKEDIGINAAVEQFTQFIMTNPGVSAERMNEILSAVMQMVNPTAELPEEFEPESRS